MITVCHVLDESASWEQRIAVGQLLDRLPRDGYRQMLASLAIPRAGGIDGRNGEVYRLPPWGPPFVAGALLNRFVTRAQVDVIHAWEPRAVEASVFAGRPVVAEFSDPLLACVHAARLRTIAESRRMAFPCSAELVRRRLIEGGVPPAHCAVIRPGVDFQRINRHRRLPVREELGIAPEHKFIMVPPSASREGGQFEGFWAGALLNHLNGNVRVIIPGDSRASRRIARFAAALPTEKALVRSHRDFDELLVHADVLVAAGHQDASTTTIAWAMAAGVPVIAAATRANAELIAHKVGGLLFKPSREGSDAPAVVRLLKDEEALAKAKEVASGLAYEVFGLRRYVEQHLKLYDNLLQGKDAGAGIEDPALSRAGS